MKFEIKGRFDGRVLFSAELAAEYESESVNVQMGAAVKLAFKNDAYLRGADLRGADLRDAYLRGADLRDADLRGADLRGAVGDFKVDGEPMKRATPEESVANLDKVREIILDNEARLDMGTWHVGDGWRDRTCAEEAVCGTSHCLAGWLQVCATDPRVRDLDPQLAGIALAPVAAKMFFRNGAETLAWLKDRKYADEAKDYA